MDELYVLIPMLVVVIVVFFYLGWIMNSRIGKKSILTAEEQAKKILEDADKDAKNIKREKLLEVKDEWYKKKNEFDKEVQQKRQKLTALEKQIQLREENSEKKFDIILQKERENKKFEQAGIKCEIYDFAHPVYPQLWSNFIPNLSIIDLLFNCGPESSKIILQNKN